MTRYYFHLVNGYEIIRDRTGIDILDLEDARAEALEAIQQFRQEDAASAARCQNWRIQVTDAKGNIGLTLELSDVYFHDLEPAECGRIPVQG